jgi:hypothetical protein
MRKYIIRMGTLKQVDDGGGDDDDDDDDDYDDHDYVDVDDTKLLVRPYNYEDRRLELLRYTHIIHTKLPLSAISFFVSLTCIC